MPLRRRHRWPPCSVACLELSTLVAALSVAWIAKALSGLASCRSGRATSSNHRANVVGSRILALVTKEDVVWAIGLDSTVHSCTWHINSNVSDASCILYALLNCCNLRFSRRNRELHDEAKIAASYSVE